MSATDTDATLVLAIRAGDDTAFTTLFQRWSDRCFDVARRIVNDDGIAAEVAQDTLLTAWQQLDTLRDPAAFGGWVLRSARNKALNRLERERRSTSTDHTNPTLAMQAAKTDVEADVTALESEELVWAAAAALGERDASILDLHLRHGLGPAELAAELDVTPNNAKQLLFRMRNRLGAGIRAWVLFRGGDARCPALRLALDHAGIEAFGREAAQVIDQHVKRCDDCTDRQATLLAPEAMFAAAPLLLLAPDVRSAIVGSLRAAGVPLGSASLHPLPAAVAAALDPGAAGASGPTGAPGASSGAGGPSRRGLAIAGAVVLAIAIAVGALLASRGGSDRSDDASRTAPTAAATTVPGGRGGGSDPSPSTTTTASPEPDVDLSGSWTADAGSILAANTANVGNPAGLSCSGPITMTFTEAGTFSRSGAVTCGSGGISASGTVATSGRYAVVGTDLTVSGTTNTGTLALGGRSVPFPDAWGDGEATVSVQGDTLEVAFTDGSVGAVTQTYRRA